MAGMPSLVRLGTVNLLMYVVESVVRAQGTKLKTKRMKKMIDKFKKASNDRLIKWVNNATEVLRNRGVNVRLLVLKHTANTK